MSNIFVIQKSANVHHCKIQKYTGDSFLTVEILVYMGLCKMNHAFPFLIKVWSLSDWC